MIYKDLHNWHPGCRGEALLSSSATLVDMAGEMKGTSGGYSQVLGFLPRKARLSVHLPWVARAFVLRQLVLVRILLVSYTGISTME